MNIYLFELDSVRNSEQEIAAGQNALFREIVLNGNTVILAYNQISDSAAFWTGLKDEATCKAIMELCRLGRIQVSLYAGQRTAAQYVLKHLEGCMHQFAEWKSGKHSTNQTFYFSLAPLDDYDGAVLEDVYHAIQYSDVQLLKEKALAKPAYAEKYTFLYRYVELILLLSRSETSNHQQKKDDMRSLMDYWEQVGRMQADAQEATETEKVLARGMAVLQRVSAGVSRKELQRRSVWYDLLNAEPDSEETNAAEAIIDLCYNYAVEDSVSGVEKRYASDDPDDFRRQFCTDMERYWDDALKGRHIFHRQDDARKNAQTEISVPAHLPDWTTALNLVRRNVKFARKHSQKAAPDIQGKTREERVMRQRKSWLKLSDRSMRYNLLLAGMYAAEFVVISYILNEVQEFVTGWLGAEVGIAGKLLLNFLSIVFFGLISSDLFSRFSLPDILETVGQIVDGVYENKILFELKKEDRAQNGGTN